MLTKRRAMQKTILAVSATLLGSLLVSTQCFAQSFPQLRQGMSYLAARQQLLEAGWQALSNMRQVNNPNRSSRITHFINLGYSEIIDCAGTGLGLCTFEFQGNQGQKLLMSVARGRETDVVFGWRIGATGD